MVSSSLALHQASCQLQSPACESACDNTECSCFALVEAVQQLGSSVWNLHGCRLLWGRLLSCLSSFGLLHASLML